MLFSSKSTIALLTALPMAANAGFRGVKTAAKAHRQLGQMGKQEGTSFCTPNPLFVGADGLPRYIEDKVVLAVLDGINSTEVDTIALGSTMGSAYNAAVNCSFSPGAIRELMGCEVIEGAAISTDADSEAYLIRCKEYFSNSADNKVFLSEKDMYSGGTCECMCGEEGVIFAQLVQDGECDCPCGFTPACECFAPSVDNFILGWNNLFTEATLDADVTVSDVVEVVILDPVECNAGVETTFNGTAICPGSGTAAFASYFTDAPTASITASPTDIEETEAPTVAPTEPEETDAPEEKEDKDAEEEETDAPEEAPKDKDTEEEETDAPEEEEPNDKDTKEEETAPEEREEDGTTDEEDTP